MANSRRLRRGVVKQLSNLSIDEVSLVDRGANQHALISIAKRAPEADDYFEKGFGEFVERSAHLAGKVGNTVRNQGDRHFARAARARSFTPRALEGEGHLTGNAHEAAGHAFYAAADHPIKTAAVGAGAGVAVHHHYYSKRAPEDTIDVDALFGDDVEKKGSFGRGGENSKTDQFSGNDPAGVLDDENGEKGDVGPDGKISGVEVIEGEDTPPKKAKKKGQGGDINPSKLSGLGKSADFWRNVVEKSLYGEFETEDDGYDEDVEKHFPGGGGMGMGQPQNPMQSPFPGAQGPGMAPTMQTPGVQPMGMGQPTPPPGGGMPSQLPPEVVQYIQQLEQALDQATGGGDDGGDGSDDSASSGSDSGSSDDKKNPFGKSLETSEMDETTFLTELAKSLDDDTEREAVNKALETVQKAEYRAKQAEEIAKAERDLRLEREFIAKAAEFNLPVKSTDLGPVLKRAAESLDADDFKTIVKCLRSASAQEDTGLNLFGEVGKRGGGDNADVLSTVDAQVQELVGKSEGLTTEAATLQVLADNPRAYDEYMRDHPSRRMFR